MLIDTYPKQFSPWEDAIILLAIDFYTSGGLADGYWGHNESECSQNRGYCGILCIIRIWTTFINEEAFTNLESTRLRSHQICYGSLRGAFDLESVWARYSDLQANDRARTDAVSALNFDILPLKPQMEKELSMIICYSQSDPLPGKKNEEASSDKSHTGDGTLGRCKTRFFLPVFEDDMKFIGTHKAQVNDARLRRQVRERIKRM
ncbi:uncharacterized protein Bfra_010114 [Botrytis fragariae]|uniref:Uncharacterized protein n=1 Tax=Botrytis fragariae TaxID=1964551 RepID=A0A8H6EF17_9HELO|nr:uncharacterized protein Bfra_010114 [Botrytis fragariae]KAF5869969.1 hypothetical protein Bfra_010114 [Botrytis fragariae]